MGKFYVYTLIDPRDGSVFYVGKGKGNRCFVHTHTVKAGTPDNNRRKCDRISEILASGLDPEAKIVAYYEEEFDALEHERELIALTPDLTNILSGYGWHLTRDECARRAVERERRILDRENSKSRDKNFHWMVAVEATLKWMTENGLRFEIAGYSDPSLHDKLLLAVSSLADKWRQETGTNLIGKIG